MRAASLSDLLKAGDRVAVSNITGREASMVTINSQRYCGNIVGGWALGKGGQRLDVPGGESIAVFSNGKNCRTRSSCILRRRLFTVKSKR